MDRAEALARLAVHPVAHLATVGPDSTPHIVPVTFALMGNAVVTMIDHKPKTTTRLRRLKNVAVNPHVALLADSYSEDWEKLWWVRVDGISSIHDGDDFWRTARQALVSKYQQYEQRPPGGPALRISIERVSSWESTP